MNILIVDDESVIRQGIRRAIRQYFPDFPIFLAASPEEAAQTLRKENIDVVLTDILMPGMTGLEMMGISRKRYPYIKWIVISAHSEFSYAQEAVRLGAKDYLLKPIGKERLIELIQTLKEELYRDSEISSDAQLLKTNLKYLREAVFHRWALGLDIGRIDLLSFLEHHTEFYLVMVKMDSDRKIHLEHYIIENVLSEIIDLSGNGFVASLDSQSLLGLVMLHDRSGIGALLETLKKHLKRYLKVPFQVIHSELITKIHTVPEEVRRMRQSSALHVYEQFERGNENVIEIALQYIRTHFHEELSLEKVASVLFLNSVYFSQLFKQKTGQGFKEYVIHLRMERAKQMLHDPRIKIADVAERIGYQDVRHFMQIFRKKYALTPTEYRQQQKQSGNDALRDH
jgi:two-component system response regulator YesN